MKKNQISQFELQSQLDERRQNNQYSKLALFRTIIFPNLRMISIDNQHIIKYVMPLQKHIEMRMSFFINKLLLHFLGP